MPEQTKKEKVADGAPITRPGRDEKHRLEKQFWDLAYANDEAGYWIWLSQRPGYDPGSPEARQMAAEAWKDAQGEIQRRRNQPRH